ncbi:hypothetical protein Pmani_025773 [Petrolisthes manimaculis]|uniref:Uncharacterized protein n=1 Tax=Petrolisthes manimaculis TaxID=1843537 RepID=A0AAE1P619_9EUCA|nr:hypothetical protein Pmani_025773 [Petrolisthes manimaculis]
MEERDVEDGDWEMVDERRELEEGGGGNSMVGGEMGVLEREARELEDGDGRRMAVEGWEMLEREARELEDGDGRRMAVEGWEMLELRLELEGGGANFGVGGLLVEARRGWEGGGAKVVVEEEKVEGGQLVDERRGFVAAGGRFKVKVGEFKLLVEKESRMGGEMENWEEGEAREAKQVVEEEWCMEEEEE